MNGKVGAGPGESEVVGVLVVDDDELSMKSTVSLLNRHGYFVMGFTTGAELLERNAVDPYQIVLLDIALDQGQSGIELGQVLRDRGYDGQIIALSGSTDPEVKAAALHRAADQFVMKGDGPDVLLGAVAAAARRCGAQLQLPLLEVLRDETTVRVRGRVIRLRQQEHAFLRVLDEHRNEIVTYERLNTALKLSKHACHTVRSRICDAIGPASKLVCNIPGVGYSLMG
ncbi:MAG: response regulator transcription factor [Polyangiaceae bacterium]|nr:response regulator transcription factor [Polyangiaceae bacterium]